MNSKSNAFLETESIGKLMRKYAVPCVISLLVAALYNIVDQIFIANAAYLGSYGNAANTVVFPLTIVALSIAVGMAAGCIPVVGYNIGANRKDRARTLFTYLLAAEAAVGAVALLIVELFPGQLIGIFGAANESSYYTAFAVKSFRVYLCMMILATVNKGTFIYLQALGKAVESTLISLAREIIFGVFLPILLPVFFGLDGLLYSFPTADILTFIIAAFIIRRTYRELSPVPGADIKGGIEHA